MSYPLMKNNISSSDLNKVINHLKKKDPILTSNIEVRKFEKLWSKWLGVKYSVFVNSGSSANLISLHILREKYPQGGEVIVSPLNWVSDITSIFNAGFTPKFVDINLNNLSMDNEKIINSISKKTVAVLLSHIQGFNGLSENLLKTLKKKKIVLIEDVCESHGAKFKKKKLGSFGLISNFSFYYAHHLSTIEGGMICTNDKFIYDSARIFRGHGMLRESDLTSFKSKTIRIHKDLNPSFIFLKHGFNMRNNEIGAIIGQNQLKRLDKNVILRNRNFEIFLKNIDKTKYFIDFNLEGSSNYAFNLIQIDNSKSDFKKLTNRLDKNKIEYRVGSAGGGNQLRQPYLKPFIKKNKIKLSDFPITEKVHFFGMYIGNYPDLTKAEIENICKVINGN